MAKKTRRIKTGISLGEFRAWLQGIEDMQEDGWSPSTSQWAKIKQKIGQIEDDHDADNEANVAVIPNNTPNAVPPQYPGTVMARPIVMNAPPNNFSSGGSFKTPDIDSSSGYKSDLV